MVSIIGASGNRKRLKHIKIRKPRTPKSKHGYIVRNANLKALGFRSYRHYLNSPMWTEIRKLAFDMHGTKCFKCSKPATEIHHSSYDLRTLSGADLKCLHPICRECHELAEFDDKGKVSFRKANRKLGLKTPERTQSDKRMSRRFSESKMSSNRKTPKLTKHTGKIKRPRNYIPCPKCGKQRDSLLQCGYCGVCLRREQRACKRASQEALNASFPKPRRQFEESSLRAELRRHRTASARLKPADQSSPRLGVELQESKAMSGCMRETQVDLATEQLDRLGCNATSFELAADPGTEEAVETHSY